MIIPNIACISSVKKLSIEYFCALVIYTPKNDTANGKNPTFKYT